MSDPSFPSDPADPASPDASAASSAWGAPATPPTSAGSTPPFDPLAAPSAPAPDAAPAKAGPGPKAWIAAGVAAAVVAVGAGFFLGHDAGSSSNTAGATQSQVQGMPGQSGQTGQNGQGMPGQTGQGMPGGGGVTGTVASVGDSSFEVTTSDGTTTVKVTSDTRITETTDGSIDDLAVGDNIMVISSGTSSSSSTVAASRIVDLGDQQLRGPGGDDDGSGQAPPWSQSDQGNGSSSGSTGSSSSNQAPQGAPQGGMPTGGTITKIDGDTITVKTRDGSTVKVTTSSSTTVSIEEALEIGDLSKGDEVSVMGQSADGTVTAFMVRVGDDAGQMGPGGGMPGQGQGMPGQGGTQTTTN